MSAAAGRKTDPTSDATNHLKALDIETPPAAIDLD
jgi:hypothetical protein